MVSVLNIVSVAGVWAHLPLVGGPQIHGFDGGFSRRPQPRKESARTTSSCLTVPRTLGGWCHARLRKGDADWRFRGGIFSWHSSALPQFERRGTDGVTAMKGSKGKRGRGGIDSMWNILLITTWLCTAHIALALLAASLYFLPQPLAVGTLASLVALVLLPVRRPFPRWGIAIARAITYAAMDYFPMSLEWEDQQSFVEASVRASHPSSGVSPTECCPSPS